jgi:hypothetical protein
MPFRLSRRFLAVALAIVAVPLAGWIAVETIPETVVDVGGGSTEPTIGAAHYGGPGYPEGALRSLLLARVRATPPGQSIDWATYYFLDAELAQALIDASDRGVHVRLVVEGDPRLEGANGAVLKHLREDGLHGGLTVREPSMRLLRPLAGKLHAKIYAFSWPRPVALVGSFNPSGGTGDDAPRIVEEIGDQDRGHNLLVEITSPGLVRQLVGHVGALAKGHGTTGRFDADNNRTYRDQDTEIFFYPRLRPEIVETTLDQLGPGDHLYAAISHLKAEAVGVLEDAKERGAEIDLIVHDTERRVPQSAVDRLSADGIRIRRYSRPDHLPMHAKFFIVENEDHWTVYFGSLNFNRNSRLLNDELLVRSTNKALARSLLTRFREIEAEVKQLDAQTPGIGEPPGR